MVKVTGPPKEDREKAERLEAKKSKDTERDVERIREKQERGETLTREEAGTLGGAARAEEG